MDDYFALAACYIRSLTPEQQVELLREWYPDKADELIAMDYGRWVSTNDDKAQVSTNGDTHV
jgi:hypothetical protein